MTLRAVFNNRVKSGKEDKIEKKDVLLKRSSILRCSCVNIF